MRIYCNETADQSATFAINKPEIPFMAQNLIYLSTVPLAMLG